MTSSSSKSRIVLDEKLTAFKKYISDYCLVKTEKSRLVVFSKRDVPCQGYMKVLESHKLVVVKAGVLSTNRKKSCDNITIFRQGNADVLLSNYKYCEGFDLINASHTLICDFDIYLSKLVQAAGRSKRLGQQHDKVHISTLVMKDSFDEFLYLQMGKSEGKISSDNSKQLEWITTRHMQNTDLNLLKRVLERITGRAAETENMVFFRGSIKIHFSNNVTATVVDGNIFTRNESVGVSLRSLMSMSHLRFNYSNHIVLSIRFAIQNNNSSI